MNHFEEQSAKIVIGQKNKEEKLINQIRERGGGLSKKAKVVVAFPSPPNSDPHSNRIHRSERSNYTMRL